MSQEELKMYAYYFTFSETGIREVDEILSAVARACKAYHHIESWDEAGYVGQIQAAASRASGTLKAAEVFAKAYKKLHEESYLNQVPWRQAHDLHWDDANEALAAYENVRGMR